MTEELEVPQKSLYNNCMMNEIKIGSEVTDGFEDGIVVDMIIDEGIDKACVWDGKEAWTIEMDKIKLVEYSA